MSKIFKSIGKVFKKVVKVAIKIAPFALAAAAVVFTGGAALGVLPTFGAAVGGVVSSLGLSAAVTGALTGAITSAGFGAALGFVTGGTKGLKKGALMGALTGGVLGAVSPATFGITTGANGAVTTSNAIAHGGDAFGSAKGLFGSGGIAPASQMPVNTGANLTPPSSVPALTNDMVDSTLGVTPDLGAGNISSAVQGTTNQIADVAAAGRESAVTQAAQGIRPLAEVNTGANLNPVASAPDLSNYMTTPATGVSAATAESGKGILSSLLGGSGGVGSNLTGLVGSVLSSLGPSESQQAAKAEEQAREKLARFAYGGVYTGNPNLMAHGMPAVPAPRYYYDKATNTVVDRQQPQGA